MLLLLNLYSFDSSAVSASNLPIPTNYHELSNQVSHSQIGLDQQRMLHKYGFKKCLGATSTFSQLKMLKQNHSLLQSHASDDL
jgi:hypothetical protein